MIITKLDVLDDLARIPVGVEYEYEGRTLPEFPASVEVLERVQVRYEVLPGWQQSTFGLRSYSQLPANAKAYLHFLSRQAGVEIAMVSTGPERDQAIWMET